MSDEEVIEDANFDLKFKSLTDSFYLPLAEILNQSKHNDSSLIDEEEKMNDVIKRTNQILCKFSPVLMIQKVVRGYFARKFRRYLIENRIWVTEHDKAPVSTTQQEPEKESSTSSSKKDKDSLHVRFKDAASKTDDIQEDFRGMKLQERSREYSVMLPKVPASTPKVTVKPVS